MSTIKLNKGDYIQDPMGEWRFAMVAQDVEIDTVTQLWAQILLVWVDEHLSGLPAPEETISIFVPSHIHMLPAERDTVHRYIGTLFDEMKEKMADILRGYDIIPFDPTDQGYDDGDISVSL